MGVFKKYAFAKGRAVKQNTFIGGVASTINTKALLASKLGISESRILLFEIKGADIRAHVVGTYGLPGAAFREMISSPTIYGLKYFFDKEGRANIFGTPGLQFTQNRTADRLEFPKLTEITNANFGEISTLRILRLKSLITIVPNTYNYQYFQNIKNCKIYMPSLEALGAPDNNEGFFSVANVKTSTIFVHPFLATCNAGAPDADLVAATAAGNTVVYVLNQTPPAKITTLTIGTKTATTLQLIFTPPTSLNTIESYEVFIDEIPYQIISGSGQYITGLTTATLYKRIEVRAIDQYYNRAEQMDDANMAEALTL